MKHKPITLTDEIVEFYNRLLDAPPDTQPGLLAEIAGDDAELRETLTALLTAGASPLAESLDEQFLDLEGSLLTGDDTDIPDAEPDVGSKYRVVQLLGWGGHGDVYLAEQQRPVVRCVAIKVLRHSARDPTVIDRLHREARVLAALDHPGIAKVLDAGRAADGRPYIVTEFVSGERIDEFCSKHPVGFEARCEMLAQLCSAVEHMHQRGIIHRDLKPGNVLVDDIGGPQPKILDFGIARILEKEPGLDATLTHAGALMGTIGFMAPEQLRGEPADTRADLFAIGKMLALCLQDVAVPQRCRRDLAAIISRATRPDARERYASVGALEADLRAMLNDRPVHARRETLRERSRRLLRQNRVASALVAVLLCVVVGTGVVTKAQADDTRRARIAQKELLVAIVDELVVTMGLYVGTAETRIELLDTVGSKTDALLAFSPEDRELRLLRAQIRHQQAVASIVLGRFDTARTHATEAVSVTESLVEPETAALDDIRRLIDAIIIRGDAELHSNRIDESTRIYEHAMDLQRRALERFPESITLMDDLCWSYDRLSQSWQDRFGSEEAIRFANGRLALAESMLALDEERVLSRYNLVMAHLRLANHWSHLDAREALRYADLAHDGTRVLLAHDPLREAFVYASAHASFLRGSQFAGLDRLDEAVADLRRALSILLDAMTRAPGTEPRLRGFFIKIGIVLSRVYAEQGRDSESTDLRRRCEQLAALPEVRDYARSPEMQSAAAVYRELQDLFPAPPEP